MNTYIITKKFQEQTVLDFLKFHHVGSKKIYEYSFKNTIFINNLPANLNSVLKLNDILQLINNEKVDYLPLDKKLDIVYEDDYLLIIDKPLNIIIHPDSKDKNGTLVNMVANYYIQNNINSNVRFIHRLDYETTGIIVFVKDFLMCSYYDYLLSINEIKRTYLALVCGNVKKDKDTLNYNIGKDRHNSKRRRVSKTGVESITNYSIVKRYKKYTLVELSLLTGRTHQIRVHMSYINHPLVGDILYGSSMNLIERVCLHSFKIELLKPLTDEIMTFTCDVSGLFKTLI